MNFYPLFTILGQIEKFVIYISTLNSEEANLPNLFQKTYYKAHKYACATKRAVLSIKSMEKLECLQSEFLSTTAAYVCSVFFF
jgi:hypothetical protein